MQLPVVCWAVQLPVVCWALQQIGDGLSWAIGEETDPGELRFPTGVCGPLPLHCRISGLTRAARLVSKEGGGDGPDGDATAEHF